jgi:hypothetical protein
VGSIFDLNVEVGFRPVALDIYFIHQFLGYESIFSLHTIDPRAGSYTIQNIGEFSAILTDVHS